VTDQNEFSRQPEWLAQTFEAKRAHLRQVAYSTLGAALKQMCRMVLADLMIDPVTSGGPPSSVS